MIKRRDFLLAAGATAAFALASVQPASGRDFSSNRISVTVEGRGPDVILIPGLTASRDMWRGTVKAVPGYRYHLVQVAGFAGEPAGANASGAVVEPVAKEIARYIEVEGLGDPALIGHSMGGTLAMMIAARHPKSVGSVMVVDMLPQPAGLFGSDAAGIAPLADSLRNILTSTPSGRRLLGNLMDRYGADEPGKPSDPDVVAQATHELARTDLRPELPAIKAPMTVLFATPAPSGTPEHVRKVQDYRVAYSGARTARLRPVPESGHMIMYDHPARFYGEVKAFLARD
jgi:pimeloyl-ACP methyl ester carboxylesterase